MLASPLKLLTQSAEEREAEEIAECEAWAAMAKERALAAKRDLGGELDRAASHRNSDASASAAAAAAASYPLLKPPPRKAPTPRQVDNVGYKKPSCLKGYSPETTAVFANEAGAKHFFSAPRVVSSAAHRPRSPPNPKLFHSGRSTPPVEDVSV